MHEHACTLSENNGSEASLFTTGAAYVCSCLFGNSSRVKGAIVNLNVLLVQVTWNICKP